MDIETAYQQALDYLYSFVDFSLTRTIGSTPVEFDLSRIGLLLERLGNPHQQYKVIHLAGTKGKGSTAALIASSLRSAGYRVGFYTSPHLQEFNERIQINGLLISPSRIVSIVEILKPFVAEIDRITTFELMTAMAFVYFAEEKVDAAVVEVGLGGRLDATNLVSPLVSVITSLSYDHMAVLGNSLSEIAFEKAGIIKDGRPVVLAPQKSEAQKVVERIANERGSRLTLMGEDWRYASGPHSLDGQTLFIWSKDDQAKMDAYIETRGRTAWKPLQLTIPLLGYHQIENAATAYATLQIAGEEGLRVSEKAIQDGFSQVFWPARFEVLQKEPTIVVVDSAHNRDSALKLRLAIEDYLPGKPIVLLFGASEDKDVYGMFSELLPRVRQLVVTESIHPRALKAEAMVEMAHRFARPAEAVLPVENALLRGLELAGDGAILVAAGSLFVAAGVRQAWHKMGLEMKNFEVAGD